MKKYIPILLLAITAFMVSCENFLDIDQPDIVEREQNFEDLQTIRSSVMGIYSTVAETVEPLFLAGEVRADLVATTDKASHRIREFENNELSGANPYVSARPFYKIIVNANEILPHLDNSLAIGAIDIVEYESLKGELLAIRAWSNMHLIKLFGKNKHVTSPMDEYDEVTVLGYKSKEEALEYIITDLEEADLYKVGTGEPEWERVRISRFYINVLLGEAYLEKGMYREAADKFNEVIRKGDDMYQLPGQKVGYTDKFKLSAKFGGSNWTKLFNKNWVGEAATEEFLFYIGFSEEYDQQNNLQNWTTSVSGSYQVKPSNWITAELSPGVDYARSVSIKTESDGNTIINKYNMDRAAGIGDAGFIVNRAARIHLLYAEAMNRLGAADTALMLINDGLNLTGGYSTGGVRGRVGLDPIEPDGSLAGGALMHWVEDLILDELARECAFEGARWFDLQRFAERRNEPAILADRVAAKFPIKIRESRREKFMDTSKWYLPLFD